MCKRIVFTTVFFFVLTAQMLAGNGRFTLVIDAGHGGKDSGALGAMSKEKNVALSVALAFGRYVQDNCPDVKVIYTRKTDVFVPLQERANIANRNKADLFVSIHCNALPKGKISRGMETYTLGMHRANDNLEVAKRENSVILVEDNYKQRYAGFDPRSSESYIMFELMQDKNMTHSIEMARLVQEKVCAAAGRSNKGVKQAGFLVLRETSMPSCLVELGFITTPDEERALNDKNKVNAIAKGLYQAFARYKSKYSGGKSGPFVAAVEQEQETPAAAKTQLSLQEKEPRQKKEVQPKEPLSQEEAKKEKPQQESRPQQQAATQPAAANRDLPVFKIQILTNDRALRAGSPLFKGLKGVESYVENDLVKYTYGASTNYNEVYKLYKSILEQFPNAFIVAFRGREKIDVNKAIAEFLANKRK